MGEACPQPPTTGNASASHALHGSMMEDGAEVRESDCQLLIQTLFRVKTLGVVRHCKLTDLCLNHHGAALAEAHLAMREVSQGNGQTWRGN